MGGRPNLDGGMLNLKGGRKLLMGGCVTPQMRPRYNLSAGCIIGLPANQLLSRIELDTKKRQMSIWKKSRLCFKKR